MIGKIILLLNNSQFKEDYNSNQSFLYQKELHSICSKPRKRKITLNFMLEESSLWTTANNLSQNILDSLEVLLIHKIYLLTSQENIFNTTKSWRLSRKTSLKNVLNYSNKSVKMLKISKNSINNSARILNLVSMKIATIETNSVNS